jgi:hypothetical protein
LRPAIAALPLAERITLEEQEIPALKCRDGEINRDAEWTPSGRAGANGMDVR